ncbi:MAG: 50S ribosomal protein L3 [Candidatus Moranbacteria bacterium RIFCSPHIGHO2_12_FULL_54_9]|nr:MAG: 50S ribosomal protein L3 [Candidatus Moranbacteria bacterium RIFCSPHIGHO2_01_FULL_54_31]OGI26125.1 MAG: 50S ribosomal protein L3 [Candidatus Moranbacteria bacterium RIFCSPHIGHO2_12_FULL_54_9]
MKFLLGKKLGMTTLFDETKGALNVTLIVCEENKVTLNRTLEKDGYLAVQLETNKTAKKTVRKEFRIDKGVASAADRATLAKELESYLVDGSVNVSLFEVGERVHIAGVTKAKGFQGTVKRYGFSGGRKSHGGKHDLRKPGSIGATFPEHVVKGRRMAGRMGGANMTARNLTVAYINPEEGLIAVRGAVPGVNGRIVKIMSAK